MSVTALLAGDPPRVGPYRLTGRLGAGGMGVVYLAKAQDDRLVALKLVRPEFAGDRAFRDRFRREVEAGQRVRGVCVARQVDAEVDGPQPYLVTEYVEGPDLAEVVAHSGPLPDDRVVGLAAGLLEALIAIHAAGIVHRDLKPANVLLGVEAPRVIDFGIAHAADATPMTQSGNVVGSAGWMAPEQATGGRITPAVDIFAWASVVVFAATGRPPFGEGRPEAVMYRVVHHRPDLAGAAERVLPLVQRAFAKDPASRPSPADLLRSLTGEARSVGSTDSVTRVLDSVWAPPPAPAATAAVDQAAPASTRGALPPPPVGAGPPQHWMGLALASSVLVIALVVGLVAWAAHRDRTDASVPSTATVSSSTIPSPVSSTTSTSSSTSTTSTTPTSIGPIDANVDWLLKQGDEPAGTVFSSVSEDDDAPTAVAVNGSGLVVWRYEDQHWTRYATITLPHAVKSSSFIDQVDATGDNRDDFVVTLDDGGTSAGSVVSRNVGSWQLVPFTYDGGATSASVPELSVTGGRVTSSSTDCEPACGTTTDPASTSPGNGEITWTYDSTVDEFVIDSTAGG